MLPRLLPIVLLLFAGHCRLAADGVSAPPGLRHDVASPHWQFGRPLARRLRVAVLAPALAQRESVELAQRLDCEVIPLMVHREEMPGTGGGVPRCLLEGLPAEIDVLVIGRIEWAALGEEANRDIIERTRAGMGLVYICPQDKRLSVDHPLFLPLPVPLAEFGGTGLAGLPGFATLTDNETFLRRSLQAYSLGTGRLLVVDYGGNAPSTHHFLTPPTRRWQGGHAHYDHYLAFLAKAIRWAGAARPSLLLSGLELPAAVAWGEPARLRLRLEGELPDRLRAELTVRRLSPSPWNPPPVFRAIVETEEEGSGAEFDLPTHLPGGDYEVRVVLRDAAQVQDWGAARFRIRAPLAVGELLIPERALPRLAASLPVTLRLDGEIDRAATVRLEVHDRHGRLAGRRETPYPAEGLRTDVSCAFSRSVHNRLTVSVLDSAGLPLLCQETEFTIPRPRDPGTFLFVMGGDGGDDYIGSLFRREAAASGVDAAVVPLGPAESRPLTEPEREQARERLMALARAGIAPMAALFDEAPQGNRSSLAEPAFRESFTATLEERAALARPFAPPGILLDGGGDMPGHRREIPAPEDWVARQRAQDRAFADVHAFARDTVRRLIPDAWTGVAGVPGDQPARSWDWAALAASNSLLNLLPDWGGEACLLRSFMQPDDLRGAWLGGHNGVARQRWLPWKLLFDGFTSAWIDAPYALADGPGELGFRPDLVPGEGWRAASAEIRRLQAGIDRLLLTAERDGEAVALVYSRPSALVSALDPGFGEHGAALAAMARLLADAGFPFRVIPAADLLDAVALRSRHQAVFLPACIALPDGAAAGLQQFAASGGLVVADWGAGRYDEAGKRRETGLLDDLFGIQPGAARGMFQPQDGIPGLLARTTVDGDVRLRRAWPGRLVEGVPTLIHAEHGAGLAVYLNISLAEYSGENREGLPAWLRRTLAREGIPEPVPVRGDRVETCRWRRGEAGVIGLLRHPRTPRTGEETHLDLPADRHAYDLLEGRYLGRGGSATFRLAPGEVKLVGLEPERISGVDFARLKGMEFATPAYRITVRAGRRAAASGRFVHVRLFDPAGKPYPAGETTLSAPDGTCEYDVPFGLAPPAPGRWRLEATDVATGLRGEVVFTMGPGE